MKKSTLPTSFISTLAVLSMLGAATPLTLAAGSTAATQAATLAAVQTKGNIDITARTTSLTGLIAKVNAATKLSASQKSSLTAEMQTEVTSLTALKAKLDADTDVPTARADFQTIFSQHYIYAFYLPRVERIITADDEGSVVTTLTTLATSLQGYITQAKTSGKDVTILQSKLSDLQTKTADANTQSQSVLASLVPLTAAGYPADKATVQGAATPLKTGRSDLETARTDAKTIVASLKKLLNLK